MDGWECTSRKYLSEAYADARPMGWELYVDPILVVN